MFWSIHIIIQTVRGVYNTLRMLVIFLDIIIINECWIKKKFYIFYVDVSLVQKYFYILNVVILNMSCVVRHLNSLAYSSNYKDFLDSISVLTLCILYRWFSLRFLFETQCKRMSPLSVAFALFFYNAIYIFIQNYCYFSSSCRCGLYRYIKKNTERHAI